MKIRGGSIISKIRKDIILYTVIAAAVCQLISLPIVGPSILFTYGLAIGVCAAVIALNIIGFSVERATDSGKRKPVIFGYIFRILLYGGALILAVNTSVTSLAGAAIGLLLPHAVMCVIYGMLPVVRRKIAKEPQPVWVTDTSSMLFVKEPSLVIDNRGKTYLTHRHYRKKRIIPETATSKRDIYKGKKG